MKALLVKRLSDGELEIAKQDARREGDLEKMRFLNEIENLKEELLETKFEVLRQINMNSILQKSIAGLTWKLEKVKEKEHATA